MGRVSCALGIDVIRRSRCLLTSSSSNLIRRYTTEELLKAATTQHKRSSNQVEKLYLRCFPIRSDDVVESPSTPKAFHRLLCEKIRNATSRVQLASLYVGTAAGSATCGNHPDSEEQELLESMRQAASAGVQVQILLDANRALRPVPIASPSSQFTNETETTTSAEACWSA